MHQIPEEFEEVLRLDETLAERVAHSQEVILEDEYQLLTQIRLARQVLADRMKVWVIVRREKPELAGSAAEVFHQAQRDYLDVVGRCEMIKKSMSDVFDIHTVYAIVRQVERIMERELKHTDVDAASLRRIIASEVTLPGRGEDNAAVESPAKIASFMDFTVPGEN